MDSLPNVQEVLADVGGERLESLRHEVRGQCQFS